MFRIVLLSLAFIAVLVAAEEPSPFDGESFTPSVSGVMITKIAPDAPAKKLGLQIGDIITSYAGKPVLTPADLIAIITANTTDAPVVVQRGDQFMTVTAKPGKLGIYLEAVEDGKTQALPPATPVTFATERLEKTPVDTWYSFIIDGKKVGAEHTHLQRAGNQL
ncbi:MAG TPA: PDZ domain-containing protein, partial [Planctomycetota bacterium]|nr:PDZ domain-containing protein [Planctomycetota bacterium]